MGFEVVKADALLLEARGETHMMRVEGVEDEAAWERGEDDFGPKATSRRGDSMEEAVFIFSGGVSCGFTRRAGGWSNILQQSATGSNLISPA